MHYLSLFTGLLALTSPSWANYIRCADAQPDEAFRVDSDGIESRMGDIDAGKIHVKTFAHVVTTAAKKGKYPLKQIKKQIQVMNKRYGPRGIQFHLAGTSFTVNNAWAKANEQTPAEHAMKKKLHRGTYADLNIYFLSDLAGNTGLLGYCPFPYNNVRPNNSTGAIKYDGCLILADSMPGGSAAPYNLGLTAVHEVGHWFGAYHVFQGNSCSGKGDYVNDTPFQKTETFGCPKHKDTCKGGGMDNVHNYMDYSDDACMTHFTPGQGARIRAIYKKYRRCNGVCQ